MRVLTRRVCIGTVSAFLLACNRWGEPAAIRRQLNAVAELVNSMVAADDPESIARAAQFGTYFTDDVEVDFGQGTDSIIGREMLIGTTLRLQPKISAFTLKVADVSVNLAPDKLHADVAVTAQLIRRVVRGNEQAVDAREFALRMKKIEGAWLIARVKAVETIR
jgi:hypothetical protein